MQGLFFIGATSPPDLSLIPAVPRQSTGGRNPLSSDPHHPAKTIEGRPWCVVHQPQVAVLVVPDTNRYRCRSPTRAPPSPTLLHFDFSNSVQSISLEFEEMPAQR